MLEFDIAGQHYRAGKLNAFQQLHLSRKLAPIIPKLLPMFTAMEPMLAATKGDAQAAAPLDLDVIANAFDPLAGALAEMPETDCDFICGLCLGVVQRQQQENHWSAIWSGKSLMFDDIDLAAMLQITVKVIGDNLGGFTQGLLAKAQAMSPAPR